MDDSEERKLINVIEKLTIEKMEKNQNFLRYTYYEVMVKNKVNSKFEDDFTRLTKIKLNNMGYSVYLKEEEFVYENTNIIVQPNELVIAIKK